MKISFDNKVLLGFAAALLLFSAVVIFSSIHIYQLTEDTKAVVHTYDVLLELKELLPGTAETEASLRGFVISGDDRFLQPYYLAIANVERAQNRIRFLTSDNLSQQKRLAHLAPLLVQETAFMAQVISLRRTKEFEAAIPLLFNKGKTLMDQIRAVNTQMESEENRLLTLRVDKEQESSEVTVGVIVVSGVLAFIIIFVAIIFVFGEIKIRRLAEEQLQYQKKVLQDVNAELDSFVYTASHDLSAPLRAISSFASFLEEDYGNQLDSQAKGYLMEVRKGADRMNSVIEDLLTLSRITRIQNPFEDVDMNKLIDAAVKRLESDIVFHHVDLKIERNIPLIHCDRIKITELFVNLINNAIKFSSKTNKGHPMVEIGYKSQDSFHQFYVRDNGIGIEEQYHEQIFGLFKRLHTSKEYEGTGAGLCIVKKVIDGHKGRVWVESQLGQGATFYFTISKNLK